MNQPKLSDLYTCQLLKLYYRLYRNKLPHYFDIFLPEFGIHNHTLRNDLIRLPAIRCEFGEMNARYQMHLRLRELASTPDTQEYSSIEISEATLGTSVRCFSNYLKTQLSDLTPICVILMTVLYVITQTNCWPYSIHT